MNAEQNIPVFTLFGETTSFPDVVHAERILDRAGQHDWVISPHRHRQMAQVFVIEQGYAEARVDGVIRQITSGEYLYIPQEIVHGFSFARGTEGMVLSFPTPILTRIIPENAQLTRWLSMPQQGPVSQSAQCLMTGFVESFHATSAFRAQSLVALSHAIFAELASDLPQEQNTERQKTERLHMLDALISQHGPKGWSPSDFASAMHVTTGHLSRITRAATGMGLSAYLEQKLMTEACRQLAFTRMPVAEVGYRLGFSDPAYFSRRFRKRIGETPSAYRARVAGQM